jgi:hypothetical protein
MIVLDSILGPSDYAKFSEISFSRSITLTAEVEIETKATTLLAFMGATFPQPVLP